MPTTYYVDFINGHDTNNNGLGPDASNGTNRPYKTITKLLVGSGMADGDTAYLSPAGPFRATIADGLVATTETKIIGDPGNAQGFKTAGGVAVAPGPVIATAYTTNDKTAPSSTTLLNMSGHSFKTFQNIMFVGGNAIIVTAAATSHDIKFTDCAFIAGYQGTVGLISATAAHGVALNWTLDRCLFLGGGNAVYVLFIGTRGSTADWSLNAVVQNSLFIGNRGYCVTTQGAGSGANMCYGTTVRNCTMIGGGGGVTVTSTHSATSPSNVFNCFIYENGGSGIGNTTGNNAAMVEDYNLIVNATPYSVNVTPGAHSISNGSYSPLLNFGQNAIWGMLPRAFAEPMAGSPMLGFGNDGNQTAYDGMNRPRPAGGASLNPGVGWLERGNTATQGTSPAPPSGTKLWQGTGPWYQDFQVPVDTSATTFSISVQRDANYTGTAPQMLILAQPEIGVAAQTITAGTAVSQWVTLTASAINATAIGVATVRLYSGDTSGTAVAEFANFAVS